MYVCCDASENAAAFKSWAWFLPGAGLHKHLWSNLPYAIQYNEEFTDLYIGKTKQHLHKHSTA